MPTKEVGSESTVDGAFNSARPTDQDNIDQNFTTVGNSACTYMDYQTFTRTGSSWQTSITNEPKVPSGKPLGDDAATAFT